MRMKLFFGVALTLFLVNTTLSQKDERALEVLRDLSDKYKAYEAFKADFKYRMENDSEDIQESIDGSVIVQGDNYQLDFGNQVIYNDGKVVWTYIPDVQEVNVAEYIPDDQEVSISNIFTIYESGYKYLINDDHTDKDQTAVDLVPEDHTKSFFKIRMTISTKSGELKDFRIFEKTGNRFLYEITKFNDSPKVTESDFIFDTDAHPDVEVIDFR